MKIEQETGLTVSDLILCVQHTSYSTMIQRQKCYQTCVHIIEWVLRVWRIRQYAWSAYFVLTELAELTQARILHSLYELRGNYCRVQSGNMFLGAPDHSRRRHKRYFTPGKVLQIMNECPGLRNRLAHWHPSNPSLHCYFSVEMFCSFNLFLGLYFLETWKTVPKSLSFLNYHLKKKIIIIIQHRHGSYMCWQTEDKFWHLLQVASHSQILARYCGMV